MLLLIKQTLWHHIWSRFFYLCNAQKCNEYNQADDRVANHIDGFTKKNPSLCPHLYCFQFFLPIPPSSPLTICNQAGRFYAFQLTIEAPEAASSVPGLAVKKLPDNRYKHKCTHRKTIIKVFKLIQNSD